MSARAVENQVFVSTTIVGDRVPAYVAIAARIVRLHAFKRAQCWNSVENTVSLMQTVPKKSSRDFWDNSSPVKIRFDPPKC